MSEFNIEDVKRRLGTEKPVAVTIGTEGGEPIQYACFLDIRGGPPFRLTFDSGQGLEWVVESSDDTIILLDRCPSEGGETISSTCGELREAMRNEERAIVYMSYGDYAAAVATYEDHKAFAPVEGHPVDK